MNTEDDEFARIEREATRGVPDPIYHTDTSETLEYITGWNDCRAAMLAEQPVPVPEPTYTYASTQATRCAKCGEHKHTPLRIDSMGGYVCLTCIDKQLCTFYGEFGYPEPAQQEPVTWGVFDGPNLHDMFFTEEDAQDMARLKGDGSIVKPLYTTPQAQQEPVAWLRKSDLVELCACNYMCIGADSPSIWAPNAPDVPSPDMELVAVYTTPQAQPAQPLTDELEALFTNIDHAISSGAWNVQTGSQTWELIQEAKAAHGIKENT